MKKIDKNLIEIFYNYAEKFYSKEISLKQIKNELKSLGIHTNSINYYIYAYPNLVDGKIFKGTINIEATEYYLDKIYEKRGISSLKNALQSLSLHIDYYQKISGIKLISQKKILENYSKKFITLYDSYFGEEINLDRNLMEGHTKQITVNIYERNPIARAMCIKHFGAICQVCEFDFEKKYGKMGKGFIHIHHITDLALIGKEYKVDFIKDLVPVCPNCHAMLHRRKPAYKITDLREILNNL